VSKFRKLRTALRDAIRRIFPKGGFFDTIFDSYDDWRDLQDEKRLKPARAKPDPES
jgi:hypothetical protein